MPMAMAMPMPTSANSNARARRYSSARSRSRVSPWCGSFASLALAPRTAPRARIGGRPRTLHFQRASRSWRALAVGERHRTAFDAYDISISLLSTLAPLLARLRAIDPKLEDQARARP
jgi:hypothetical protein